MGRNKRVILGRFPNVVSVVNPTLAHKVAEGPTLVEILRGTRVVDVAPNVWREFIPHCLPGHLGARGGTNGGSLNGDYRGTIYVHLRHDP